MTSSAENSPPSNRPAKSSFERRAVRLVLGALATVFALALIWVAVQLLWRRPYPPMLYTEADMPKLPAQEENGWEILRSEFRAAKELDRPAKEIAEICDHKATFTDRWMRVWAQSQKISALATNEKTKQWLSVIDKVAMQPRFADACPITFEPDCPRPLQLLVLHQTQEAVVLHDALDGHWDDALERALTMLRLDIEYLPSARATLSQAVSRAHVHRAMKLVDVLLDGVAQEKQAERKPDAARMTQWAKDVNTLLGKIREEDVAPIRIVIAEYLFSAYALDNLATAPQGRFSRGSVLLYDPGHAFEMLNARFRQYAEFAERGGTGDVPQFPPNRLYLLHNPTGHLAVEATRGPLESQIPAMVKDRGLLFKDREALQKRLQGLANFP